MFDVCHLTELQGFDLADHDASSDGEKSDALIESDCYWEVISGEIMKDTAGPVAIKFGWALSGPVKTKAGPQGFTTISLVLQGSNAVDPSQNTITLNDELQHFRRQRQ